MQHTPPQDGHVEAFRRSLQMTPVRTFGVLAIPGFQALSLWGPLEVLGDCSPAVQPIVVAATVGLVASEQGPRIHSDVSLDDAPRFDLLLIPGGNIGHAREDPDLLHWIDRTSSDAETVMTVGSGTDLLADTGHLDGRRASANHSIYTSAGQPSTVDWTDDTCQVTDGRYVTCCRAGAAIDMALGVVSQLLGSKAAQHLGTHL